MRIWLQFLTIVSFSCFAKCFAKDELGSASWLKTKMAQYPELLWLADQHVKVTNDYAGSEKESYSQIAFKSPFVEFDRTLLAIEFLERTYRGTDDDYQWLVQSQKGEERLTKASFTEYHQQLHAVAATARDYQILELRVILSDMGKTKKARELLPELAREFSDQDQFYSASIRKAPQVFPSYLTYVKGNAQSEQAFQLAAHSIHFGHVTHLEGNENMFRSLKETGLLVSTQGLHAFEQEFLTHIADVAGAAGHVSRAGSVLLTELTYQKLKHVFQAALILKNHSTQDALKFYTNWYAEYLGLKVTKKEDEVVVRLAAMVRASSNAQVVAIRTALSGLKPADRELVLGMFAFSALPYPIQTPTYIPAVLANLSKNPEAGSNEEQRLAQSVQTGALAVAKALKAALNREDFKKGTLTLNFNPMAGLAKGKLASLGGKIEISPNGEVSIRF